MVMLKGLSPEKTQPVEVTLKFDAHKGNKQDDKQQCYHKPGLAKF